MASLSLSFLAGTASGATPQDLAKSAHEAVLKGQQKPGATLSEGMVIAVGRAPVASFGNARRSALRAEEQAELAALGELRLWAMANRNVDMDALTAKLGRPVPPEALRAYLGTVAGDVQIKDILAKENFSEKDRAYSVMVIAADSIGAAQIDPEEFSSGLEEFLETEPSVGEAAYQYFGAKHAEAENWLLRHYEAEGLPTEGFRDPFAKLDVELNRLSGEAASAATLEDAKTKAKDGEAKLAAGDLDGARSSFLSALAVEPLLGSANAGLAKVYLERKMPSLALRFVVVGYCGEGDRKELYEAHAKALTAAGEGDAAKLASALAGLTQPGDPVAQGLLSHYKAAVDAKRGRTALLLRCDGHLPFLEQKDRWTARPEAAELFAKAKTAFGKSKDTTEALGIFLEAIDANPFQVDALNYAAACFRVQENAAGARLMALLATRVDPKHAPARVNLALGLEALGVPELAKAELEQARDLQPQDAWSQKKITEGLARLGGGSPGGDKP